MNRLERFVRRTVIERARDGYVPAGGSWRKAEDRREALKAALIDATRGVDTGWWGDLIYTRDVYRMAAGNRRAIAEALAAYQDAAGEPLAAVELYDRPGAASILTACLLAPSFPGWERLDRAGKETLAEARAEDLMFGLRFAVEWYASEYGSEVGI